jgi:hypothetical protein
LGISAFEGAVVGAIPMVPDRLSYTEMYIDAFKYPSEWTDSFASYKTNKHFIVAQITEYIENYKQFLPSLNKQVDSLKSNFFSCNSLLEKL